MNYKTIVVLAKTLEELHWLLIESWSWCCLLGRTASYLPDNHKLRQKGIFILPFGSSFAEAVCAVFHRMLSEDRIENSYVIV